MPVMDDSFQAFVTNLGKYNVLGACTGCGACAAKCPRKAIVMRDRRAPRNKMDKVKKAPVAPAAKPAAPAAAKEPEQKA